MPGDIIDNPGNVKVPKKRYPKNITEIIRIEETVSIKTDDLNWNSHQKVSKNLSHHQNLQA